MRPLALATAARACDGGPRIAIDLPSGDPKVSATITASQPQATSAIAPAILLNLRSAPLEPFPFRLNRNKALSFCFDAFSSREPVSTSLENALADRPIHHKTAQSRPGGGAAERAAAEQGRSFCSQKRGRFSKDTCGWRCR